MSNILDDGCNIKAGIICHFDCFFLSVYFNKQWNF
jgi:hypothetical protein